ncbi:MAG: thermonuclease family protein [Bacteroidetes bacterium]|nr:thermonuclease family protein [Bacteroidota bacterium]
MGTLRVHGTIDISQFWPAGTSDADTTKIKLIVNKNSFEYKEKGATKFSSIKLFNDAQSKGQVSKKVVTVSKKTGDQTITVRLQGVDAPELHYKAAPLKTSDNISTAERKKFNDLNKERRQNFGETATVELKKHLEKFANPQGLITAVFETEVDAPSDVVDTYGRFVGNIRIGKSHIVNEWLVEDGWGHPAFYTSMSATEIQTFLALWKKGKKKKNRPGKFLSKDANNFDWALLYAEPKKNQPVPFTPGEDKGDVLMPKIFRRQVSWLVSKKAGVISNSTGFKTYLKKKPDQLVLLNDFLQNGVNSAQVFALDEFITADNKILKNPEEMVFKEKPSILVDPGGNKITKWK